MSADPASLPLRRPGAISGITGVRLLPQGASAELVNMSSTGVLVESMAKVQVGAAITVAFDGGFTPSTASGRVVRCEVAVMGRDGLLRYHLGIEFDTPMAFGRAEDATPPPESPQVRNRW